MTKLRNKTSWTVGTFAMGGNVVSMIHTQYIEYMTKINNISVLFITEKSTHYLSLLTTTS